MRARWAVLPCLLLLAFVVTASARSDPPQGWADTVKSSNGCTCHTASPNPNTIITLQGLPATYAPGQSYTLTLTSETDVTSVGTNKGGFLVNVDKGTIVKPTTNANWYRTGSSSGVSWIHHELAGEQNNANQQWSFSWTAPSTRQGDASLNVYVNRVNGVGGNDDGDHWNRKAYTVKEEAASGSPTTTRQTSTTPTRTTPGGSPVGNVGPTATEPGLAPLTALLAIALVVALRRFR